MLVAVAIVGIAVVPLIGTLALSLSGAAEHRNLATIDTVLRSFAETAKSELQINGSSSTFNDNNTTYPLLSLANPSTGPVGTAVTVFGTGFHPNVSIANFTVNIGLSVLTAANNGISSSQSQSVSDANGNMQVTFIVPTGLTPNVPQQIEVSDGSGSSVFSMANTGFTVTTGTSPVATSPLQGYTMGIPASNPTGIEYWSAAAGGWSTSPVTGSGLQLITLQATSPGGASDTLSFVLRNQADNPTPVPTPLVVVTPSSTSVILPATLVFTATVQPSATNPTPTGTIAWSIGTTPQVTTPSCTTTTALAASTGNSATATCSLTLTSASMVGTYTAKATYSGDSYNNPANGSNFAVVMATPAVTVSFNNQTQAGQPATFTATIAPPASGDPAPSGTVTWSFAGLLVPSNANSTNCPANTLTSGGTGSQTATCSFTAQVGIWSYTATATYSGDTNYNAGNGTDTVSYTVTTVSKKTPTLAMTYATGGSGNNKTLTFTLTVSGVAGPPPLTPTGTVTWSNLSPGSLPTACTTPVSLVATTGDSAAESCTITSVSPSTTYSITATYSGDSNFTSQSANGQHAG